MEGVAKLLYPTDRMLKRLVFTYQQKHQPHILQPPILVYEYVIGAYIFIQIIF